MDVVPSVSGQNVPQGVVDVVPSVYGENMPQGGVDVVPDVSGRKAPQPVLEEVLGVANVENVFSTNGGTSGCAAPVPLSVANFCVFLFLFYL